MTDHLKIEPTIAVPILDGEVVVYAFGRRQPELDFSLRGIERSEDATSSHGAVLQALASIPSRGDYYAPTPSPMNAEIVSPSSMVHRWACAYPLKTAAGGAFTLFRGGIAEGLRNLTPRCGYVMSPADCALIVVESEGLVIAAHAGRESVIDVGRFKGRRARRFESIVENICVRQLPGSMRTAKLARVWIGLSVSPGPHFEHVRASQLHPHNDAMLDHVVHKYGAACVAGDGAGMARGWLDLKALVRQQFVHYGVPEGSIVTDGVCTHTDEADGKRVWWSNSRGDAQRNLVAVVRMGTG